MVSNIKIIHLNICNESISISARLHLTKMDYMELDPIIMGDCIS